MANVVRIHRGEGNEVQLSVWLPGWRQAMISVENREGEVVIGIWGRHRGEPHYHAWPGPHLEKTFFSAMEAAILRYGVEEAAACSLNQQMDEDFATRIMGALTVVLDAAANGMRDDKTPVAA